MLPRKVIGGASVFDYAYYWIEGNCLLHQWCSGARGIDNEVIQYATDQLSKIIKATQSNEGMAETGWTNRDAINFKKLLDYLKANKGAPAEQYIPDKFNRCQHGYWEQEGENRGILYVKDASLETWLRKNLLVPSPETWDGNVIEMPLDKLRNFLLKIRQVGFAIGEEMPNAEKKD